MTDRLPDMPLTTRDLATHLQVSFRSVQRWAADKKIKPSFVTKGGHRRFSLADANKIRRSMCPRPVKTKTEEPDILD